MSRQYGLDPAREVRVDQLPRMQIERDIQSKPLIECLALESQPVFQLKEQQLIHQSTPLDNQHEHRGRQDTFKGMVPSRQRFDTAYIPVCRLNLG